MKVGDLIGNDRTGRRVALQEPGVGLPAIIAIPLGLAFHQLATNAAKYGALSGESRRELFLAALIVLYVAAAIIHAFVWQDRTLARMWSRRSAAT